MTHPVAWRAALAWGGAIAASMTMVPSMAAGPPDALRGEQIYVRCMACHALTADRVGPRHCGLLGRAAGSVPGFAYSPAMKNAKLVWDEKTLDLFIRKPLQLVPGTAMTYDGVPDPWERADLIAYLKKAGESQACKGLR